MKARAFSIIGGNIAGIYDVEYSTDITPTNIRDVMTQAKRHHSIPGKVFTVVTEDKRVFHTFKHGKEWTAYELKGTGL